MSAHNVTSKSTGISPTAAPTKVAQRRGRNGRFKGGTLRKFFGGVALAVALISITLNTMESLGYDPIGYYWYIPSVNGTQTGIYIQVGFDKGN